MSGIPTFVLGATTVLPSGALRAQYLIKAFRDLEAASEEGAPRSVFAEALGIPLQARAPHAHCICTARALHAHRMRTACAPHVHRTRTARAPHVHRTRTARALLVHCLCTACALLMHRTRTAHCMYTAPLHVHCIACTPPQVLESPLELEL